MRNILLIFIDGLGLGDNDPSINPLVKFDPSFFRQILNQTINLSGGSCYQRQFLFGEHRC